MEILTFFFFFFLSFSSSSSPDSSVRALAAASASAVWNNGAVKLVSNPPGGSKTIQGLPAFLWLSVFPAQRASSQPPQRRSSSHFPIEFRHLSAAFVGLCMWGRTDPRFSFSDCHIYPHRPCRDLASWRCVQLSELDRWRKWSSRGCTWLWSWWVAWHLRVVFHQFLAEGASQWARRSLGCLFHHCRGSLSVESTSLSWWLNVEGLHSNIPDSSSDPFSSSSSSESLLELDLEPSLQSDTGILFGSFRWRC